MFLFVRVMGFDSFTRAPSAKLLNTATNMGALILFASTGHVWWHLAAVMAVANVLGSLLGTRLGAAPRLRFRARVFICVVTALIAKTAWDGYSGGRVIRGDPLPN